jgi:hypothetical protein
MATKRWGRQLHIRGVWVDFLEEKSSADNSFDIIKIVPSPTHPQTRVIVGQGNMSLRGITTNY